MPDPESGSRLSGQNYTLLTRDHISYHAALRPKDIAVIDNGRKYTYAQFHRDLGRFTRALREFDLPVSSTAAVEWTSLYNHWLIVLGFEALGVAT